MASPSRPDRKFRSMRWSDLQWPMTGSMDDRRLSSFLSKPFIESILLWIGITCYLPNRSNAAGQ